jgi:hypothetical protein
LLLNISQAATGPDITRSVDVFVESGNRELERILGAMNDFLE